MVALLVKLFVPVSVTGLSPETREMLLAVVFVIVLAMSGSTHWKQERP